ncbi:unnamed protein product, partial [Closterium sp. NIES-53]
CPTWGGVPMWCLAPTIWYPIFSPHLSHPSLYLLPSPALIHPIRTHPPQSTPPMFAAAPPPTPPAAAAPPPQCVCPIEASPAYHRPISCYLSPRCCSPTTASPPSQVRHSD